MFVGVGFYVGFIVDLWWFSDLLWVLFGFGLFVYMDLFDLFGILVGGFAVDLVFCLWFILRFGLLCFGFIVDGRLLGGCYVWYLIVDLF